MDVSSCSGTPNSLIIPVRYFLNKPGGTGWLHMTDDPFDSTITADANGMVRMKTLSDGTQTFDGKGKVKVLIDGCPVVVDLSSVNDLQSQFGDCSIFTEGLVAAAPSGFCFHVHFDRVTVGGVDIGGADMDASPPCAEGDERAACSPSFVEPEID
jgi:hypothetical protein